MIVFENSNLNVMIHPRINLIMFVKIYQSKKERIILVFKLNKNQPLNSGFQENLLNICHEGGLQ